MKHLFHFFVCLILLALSACQASFFHLSDLETNAPIASPLPPLLIEWDWMSLQQSFPVTFPEEENASAVVLDVRLQDTRTLMEREIRDNLSSRLGNPQGYAVCRVVGQHRYQDLQVLGLLSIASCFLLNIVGMPATRQNAEVELELEIRDANDQLLASYQGRGDHRIATGLYYGRDATRKTHVEACKEALAKIRAEVEKDVAELSRSLISSGPIR